MLPLISTYYYSILKRKPRKWIIIFIKVGSLVTSFGKLEELRYTLRNSKLQPVIFSSGTTAGSGSLVSVNVAAYNTVVLWEDFDRLREPR